MHFWTNFYLNGNNVTPLLCPNLILFGLITLIENKQINK